MKIHHDNNKRKWIDYLIAVKRSRGLISLPLENEPLNLESGDIEG
jgi:hypothetical protein